MKWWHIVLVGIGLGALGMWLFLSGRSTKEARALHDKVVSAEQEHVADSTARAQLLLAAATRDSTLGVLQRSIDSARRAGAPLAGNTAKLKEAEDSAKAAIGRSTTLVGTLNATTAALTATTARADASGLEVVSLTGRVDLLERQADTLKADTLDLGKRERTALSEAARWRGLAQKGDTIAQRLPPKLFLGIFGAPRVAVGLGGTAGYGVVEESGTVHVGRGVALGLTAGVVIPIGGH